MAARFEAMWAHKTVGGTVRAMACRVLPCALAGCCLLFLAGCGADAGDAGKVSTAPAADSSAAASGDDAETSAVDTIRQAAVAQNTAETERASAAIRQAIELVSAPYGETVSVTYLPVGSPAGIVSVNGATQHASASMIKLVVLAALLDKAAAGQIDLAAQVEVTSSDIVSGTGTVQDDGPGTYELRELARRMIADSDNTATNVIVDLIGMDAVNEEASKLGLTGTVMARKMMDMVAADQGMRNRMTSDDAATILNLIASGKLVNEQMSELAMSFLLQQTINAGLTDAIPAGVRVAHKTGELIQAEHDGGIVLAAHPYVLVVMTEGIDNGPGGAVLLQRRGCHGAGVALLGVVGVDHDVLEVDLAGVLLLEPLDHLDRERPPGVVRLDEAGAVGDRHVARAADAGADDLAQAVLVVALLEQPHEVGLGATADGVAVVDLVSRVVLGLELADLVAVLGVLHLERLVEVGVGVAEAGRDEEPVGFYYLGGVPGFEFADRRDDAVLHGDVQGPLGPEHVAALDQEVVDRLGPGGGDG